MSISARHFSFLLLVQFQTVSQSIAAVLIDTRLRHHHHPHVTEKLNLTPRLGFNYLFSAVAVHRQHNVASMSFRGD
jgi:hypothetical protein